MTHVELLRATELFAKLTNDELAAVERCVVEHEAKAGEVLIREGQPGQSLYLLRKGKVLVEKSVGEQRVKLAELGEGAAFGEMSLIDSAPTSASVTAVEASSLLVISRLDLNVLLTWDTVLGSKMWRSFTEMLCTRLRAANEKMAGSLGEQSREFISAAVGIDSH